MRVWSSGEGSKRVSRSWNCWDWGREGREAREGRSDMVSMRRCVDVDVDVCGGFYGTLYPHRAPPMGRGAPGKP